MNGPDHVQQCSSALPQPPTLPGVPRMSAVGPKPDLSRGSITCSVGLATTITLNNTEQQALERLIAISNTPKKAVWCTEIVPAKGRELKTMAISKDIGTPKKTAWRWQQRYVDEGAGLERYKTRPPGTSPSKPEAILPIVSAKMPPRIDATSIKSRGICASLGAGPSAQHIGAWAAN